MKDKTVVREKLDYKKKFKDLYLPKEKPCIIDVPAITFIMVDGKGNPNIEGGEYQQAVELLYAISYTIKMSKLNKYDIAGYFDYVVPPLEGLWWLDDNSHSDFSVKEKFCWTSMIRQPEFVTSEVLNWACTEVSRKKPNLDTSKVRLQTLKEDLCVQMMHIGPFADEPKTVAQINRFIEENNYIDAISDVQPCGKIRRHHEIYLSDPRKVEPSKMKTILRHPVKIKE